MPGVHACTRNESLAVQQQAHLREFKHEGLEAFHRRTDISACTTKPLGCVLRCVPSAPFKGVGAHTNSHNTRSNNYSNSNSSHTIRIPTPHQIERCMCVCVCVWHTAPECLDFIIIHSAAGCNRGHLCSIAIYIQPRSAWVSIAIHSANEFGAVVEGEGRGGEGEARTQARRASSTSVTASTKRHVRVHHTASNNSGRGYRGFL